MNTQKCLPWGSSQAPASLPWPECPVCNGGATNSCQLFSPMFKVLCHHSSHMWLWEINLFCPHLFLPLWKWMRPLSEEQISSLWRSYALSGELISTREGSNKDQYLIGILFYLWLLWAVIFYRLGWHWNYSNSATQNMSNSPEQLPKLFMSSRG